MMTLEQIVRRIAESSGLSVEEIMERIRKIREKFELLTPEGAARIVAQELGVKLETAQVVVRPLRIEDLAPGMSRIDLVARVIRIYPVREFQYSSGRMGKRGGVLLQDATGTIRLALWDDQNSVLEAGMIQKGDAVRIKNGYVVKGIDGANELRLGNRGAIESNPSDPRVDELPPFSAEPTKIGDLRPEMGEADVLGRVASVGGIRTFERPDGGMAKVATLMLDDGSGVIRVSLWEPWAELVNRLEVGRPLMLENATVRTGFRGGVELSVGGRSRVIIDPPGGEELPPVRERMVKVKEVEPNMPSVNIALRIKRVFPVVEFRRSDGSTSQVLSVIGSDDTGTIRVSFWDEQVEKAKELKQDDVLLLKNAYSRTGLRDRPEIHVGRNTLVEINPSGVEVEAFKPCYTKLGDVEIGDEGLEVVGRVLEVQPLREYATPDGRTGKVLSMLIADETAALRINFWREKADLVAGVKRGDVLRASDVYCSAGLYGLPELHLARDGEVEINPAGVELPPVEDLQKLTGERRRVWIEEIDKAGERVEIRGTIVHVFQRKPLFYLCPECGKSVSGEGDIVCENCGKHITPIARAVLSFLCDDGTGNIRTTVFGDLAERALKLSAQELSERLKSETDPSSIFEEAGLIGREVVVRGVVKYDSFSDALELRGLEIEEPAPIAEGGRLLEEIKELRIKKEGELSEQG